MALTGLGLRRNCAFLNHQDRFTDMVNILYIALYVISIFVYMQVHGYRGSYTLVKPHLSRNTQSKADTLLLSGSSVSLYYTHWHTPLQWWELSWGFWSIAHENTCTSSSFQYPFKILSSLLFSISIHLHYYSTGRFYDGKLIVKNNKKGFKIHNSQAHVAILGQTRESL